MDKNLLLWDAEGGVKMHDCIRDYARLQRGPAALRLHQRALITLLLSPGVAPNGRWRILDLDPTSVYVRQALAGTWCCGLGCSTRVRD